MMLDENDQAVQTFFAHRSHPAFGDRICIRSLIGNVEDLDAPLNG